MKPEALKVATDILRELGLEDVARWVEHPEAARDLLGRARYVETQYNSDEVCCDCGAYAEEPHSRTQLMDSPGRPWRDCIVAAAWRALGDPRGAEDIERAHEEALREQVRRNAPANGGWVGTALNSALRGEMVEVRLSPPGSGLAPGISATPSAQAADDIQRQINERIESASERILGHRLTTHDQGALVLRHARSNCGLAHVTILRNDVEQVTISAAVLGDAVDLTEHWRDPNNTPARP